MNIFNILIITYLIPVIICLIFTYFHKETKTLGDLFYFEFFIPIFNVFFLIGAFFIKLKESKILSRIKNIKIK